MKSSRFHLDTLFALMDTIPPGAVLSDVEFRLLKLNKAAERIWGYRGAPFRHHYPVFGPAVYGADDPGPEEKADL